MINRKYCRYILIVQTTQNCFNHSISRYKYYQGHIKSFGMTKPIKKVNLCLIYSWNRWKMTKSKILSEILYFIYPNNAFLKSKLLKMFSIHNISHYEHYKGYIKLFVVTWASNRAHFILISSWNRWEKKDLAILTEI